MPETSQPTPKSNPASEEAQAIPGAPSEHPDQNGGNASEPEGGMAALFKAAQERTAKMTSEETQKEMGWGPTPPGCSADAFMRWLEEEEAERIKSVEEEEDGHDGAGDAADKVPEKPDTKPKD